MNVFDELIREEQRRIKGIIDLREENKILTEQNKRLYNLNLSQSIAIGKLCEEINKLKTELNVKSENLERLRNGISGLNSLFPLNRL